MGWTWKKDKDLYRKPPGEAPGGIWRGMALVCGNFTSELIANNAHISASS